MPLFPVPPTARADFDDGWRPAMARQYVAPKLARPPTIDGDLGEDVWRDVPWTDDFRDIAAGPKPRLRTRVKMAWDERCLYVAAELEEPHVWATLTERDSVIFHDNDFEVFVDPDSDLHGYYELEVNALNTVWDLKLPRPYRAGGRPDNAFQLAGLRTSVKIDGTLNDPSDLDRRWTVEIALPFSAVDSNAPKDGELWRINFSRVQWQTDAIDGRYVKRPGVAEDNWTWSPQGVIDMHRPERWGLLQFSDRPPGERVEPRPDPLAAARWYLVRIQERQRRFREEHGRWATLKELAVTPPPAVAAARFAADGDGFTAAVETPQGRLTIRNDARLRLVR